MIKNLGQIAGLWVSNTSPQNRLLIWFDTGNNIHKTYDYSTGTWIPVSMNPIVNKTYAELQNLAALNSISQGTFYRITNLGYLALAITSTKIQYTDNNNNVIIDDLISTKTYCVTSSNLLIEDKGGVWDVSTNTLKFNFEDTDIANDPSATTADDYVLGTKLRSGTKKLSKYKLSSLISGVTGNAITWNKGFFLNFLTNLQSYYDVNGGVVRYTTYTAAINTINQSLNTLQQNINNLNIWNKTMPSPFNPPATPTDMAANDTMKTLFQKAQAWINKFKNAKGIVLSSDYVVDNSGVPAIGDTVEQAIGKIQYEAQGLPSDWNPSTTSSDPTVAAGDTFAQAFAKVQRWFNLFWHISTNRFWSSSTYDGSNPIFDFNANNGSFSIRQGVSNNYTLIDSGSITQKKGTDYTLMFGNSGATSTVESVGNENEFDIISWSMSGDNGTVDLITYNTVFKEPTIPSFVGINNQDFVNSGCYALFAESILSKVKATKFKYLTFGEFDFNYEINRDTPEYLILRNVLNTGWVPNVNFKVNEVRDGQIINVILISGQSGGIGNITFSKSSNAPSHMSYAFQYIYTDGSVYSIPGTHTIPFTQDYRIMKLICFHRSREASPISNGSFTDTVMLLK